MRAYFFTNMYLSSIQNGIQSAHATHELFNKYIGMPGEQFGQLGNWSRNHKTMIVLNGGYASNLQEIYDLCENQHNPYPFAKFNEEKDSLNSALTCVAIVLPEKIYITAAQMRRDRFLRDNLRKWHEIEITPDELYGFECEDKPYKLYFNDFELDLIDKMNQCGMAS